MNNRTFLKMLFNGTFTFETFVTEITTKLFVVQMYWQMVLQFTQCIKTLWTFTAHIRLHTCMSKYMFPKVATEAELLLRNVTYEPSTFIV